MKIAILGSGGREHALTFSIYKSDKVEKIYCIPGNAGTSSMAENISLKVVGEDPGRSQVRYTPPHGHGSIQYLKCQSQLSESSMMRGDSQNARLIIVRCYMALVRLSKLQTRL